MAPPSPRGSSLLLPGALLFGLGGVAGFVVHALGGRAAPASATALVVASAPGAVASLRDGALPRSGASALVSARAPAMAELQLPSELPEAPRLKMHAELEAGQLLERAHGLLGSKPAVALELTQEHDREFPSGPLQSESDLIAAEALVALGDVAEAQRRARESLARQPNGPRAARLREIAALK